MAKTVMGLARRADKTLHILAELAGEGIGRCAFEQSQFLFQFLGPGFDMGQAGLPILGMHPFVGSIGVSDDGAAKTLTQDTLGRLGGAVLIQVEESQVLIAGIPDPILATVVAPGGFVGMNHGQGADFLAQIFIERQAAAHGLTFEAISTGGYEAQTKEITEE